MSTLINGPRDLDEHPELPDRSGAGPEVQRYIHEVQAGMSRFQEILEQRDDLRRKLDDEILKNDRLHIQIAQAAESERIHVAKLVEEAIVEGKRWETQCTILQDELASLRAELVETRDKLIKVHASEARLLARVDLIAAALQQTVKEQEESDEQAT
jgi:chromosome segregation ATPase